MLKKLAAFKERHGHCNVGSQGAAGSTTAAAVASGEDDAELAAWGKLIHGFLFRCLVRSQSQWRSDQQTSVFCLLSHWLASTVVFALQLPSNESSTSPALETNA